MGPFRKAADHYVASFQPNEAMALFETMLDVIALLSDGFDRSDPVIARLFPDFYPNDQEASEELRRYTEEDLRSAKLEQAAVLLDALPVEGGAVALSAEQAEAWLRALTDALLALGMRLGVSQDTDVAGELDEAVLKDPVSPRVGQLSLFAYLIQLQASLVEAVCD